MQEQALSARAPEVADAADGLYVLGQIRAELRANPTHMHVHSVDMIVDGKVKLVINTPFGHGSRGDGYALRLAAVRHGITYATTISAAQALAAAMEALREHELGVLALQDLSTCNPRLYKK